ncbi:MAG: hypothetical protein IKL10_03840 [Clostridia bacterium]|nr:hypothetical protein [Clostridia bacterium]
MRSIEEFIKCPFFLKEGRATLQCEGYIKGTCMTTQFPERSELIKYVLKNCAEINGGKCFMATNLFEKYRRLEEKEDSERKKIYSTIKYTHKAG